MGLDKELIKHSNIFFAVKLSAFIKEFTFFKILLPVAMFGLLLGLVACNNGGNNNEPGNKSEPASSQAQTTSAKQEKITITAADGKTKLILGQEVQLTASVEGVKWESDHPEIVEVNENGKAISKAVGRATIKATKEGYNS